MVLFDSGAVPSPAFAKSLSTERYAALSLVLGSGMAACKLHGSRITLVRIKPERAYGFVHATNVRLGHVNLLMGEKDERGEEEQPRGQCCVVALFSGFHRPFPLPSVLRVVVLGHAALSVVLTMRCGL